MAVGIITLGIGPTGTGSITHLTTFGLEIGEALKIWTDQPTAGGDWTDQATAGGTWTDQAKAGGEWTDV